MGCARMSAFAGENRVIHYEAAVCGVGRHDTGGRRFAPQACPNDSACFEGHIEARERWCEGGGVWDIAGKLGCPALV